MSLTITSYGAAGTVTGSAHLIEMDGARILVDLGMFQGLPEVEMRNREPLGFDPRSLDAVILTHGHTDHVGRMPLLIPHGYRGPIYATHATRDVARLILVDSARIQAEDHRRQRGRTEDGPPVPPPLYSEQDVYETLDLIEPRRMEDAFLIKGVTVCLRNAGHILGSAFVEFTGRAHRFIASGDVGHWGPHVVPSPDLPDPAGVVMVESTYGDTIHPPMSEAVDKLIDVIHRTIREGGNVLIPSFALERTQDVLHQLRIAYDKRRLPRNLHVYLDSPLGIKFTQLYRRYPEQLTDSVKAYIKRGESPFRWDDVSFTIAARESREIADRTRGAVIMAGSGMANGGRILNHLKENLARPESAVVFVGYQAEGTLGRELVEGAESVTIDDETFQVRAQILEIDGFSAHADQVGLTKWVRAAGNPATLLVHGEDEGPLALQKALKEEHNIESTISEWGVPYEF
jgi:metallo-beta-lactamase family protein